MSSHFLWKLCSVQSPNSFTREKKKHPQNKLTKQQGKHTHTHKPKPNWNTRENLSFFTFLKPFKHSCLSWDSFAAKIGITLSLNRYPGCSFSQMVSVESLTVDQCFWIFIQALKGLLKINALFPRTSYIWRDFIKLFPYWFVSVITWRTCLV